MHDHDSIVAAWKKNAQRDADRNYQLLRKLKYHDEDYELDETAHEFHRQAFEKVDCTRCANCCKTLVIQFNREDVERISAHFNLSPDEFIARYLEPVQYEKDCYGTKQPPCPFLGPDDRCTIYEIRPSDCRDYPFTDKPEFTSRTMGIAENTVTCPAVYYIVEQLKRHAGGRRRR
jgi:Fe-S-cluster containining protein